METLYESMNKCVLCVCLYVLLYMRNCISMLWYIQCMSAVQVSVLTRSIVRSQLVCIVTPTLSCVPPPLAPPPAPLPTLRGGRERARARVWTHSKGHVRATGGTYIRPGAETSYRSRGLQWRVRCNPAMSCVTETLYLFSFFLVNVLRIFLAFLFDLIGLSPIFAGRIGEICIGEIDREGSDRMRFTFVVFHHWNEIQLLNTFSMSTFTIFPSDGSFRNLHLSGKNLYRKPICYIFVSFKRLGIYESFFLLGQWWFIGTIKKMRNAARMHTYLHPNGISSII